jgi:hypothetical protein
MARGSGGGGYHSRPHVEKPVKTGTGSRGVHEGGVGQLGEKQGNHVTSTVNTEYRGHPLHNDRSFQPVKFGNEMALNCGKDGRGGRTNYGTSGSQGCHGQPDRGSARPQGRGILNNE